MNRIDWIEQSSCRAYEITATDDPWHAEGSSRAERAKQRIALDICARCPVKDQCLTDALGDELQYGIRGGLTAPERTRLKNGAAPTRTLSPCGTRSAYQRHLRNGETLDQACIDAESNYQVGLREQRRARKAAAS